MSKIINTLKNGTGKAKLIIVLAVLSCLAAAGFVAIAIILKQLLYFFGTVICVFIAISLRQTLDVYEYQGKLYKDGAQIPAEEKQEEPQAAEAEPVDEPEDEPEAEPEEEPQATQEEPEESAEPEAEEEDEDEDVSALLDKMNNLLDAADVDYDDSDEDEDMDVLAEIISESGEEAEETHKHKNKHKNKRKTKKSRKEKAEESEQSEKPEKSEKKKKEKKEKKERNKNTKSKTKSEANPETDSELKEKEPDKGKLQEDILEDELEKDLKFLKTNISGNYDDNEEKDKEENKEDKEDDDEPSKKLIVVKQVSEDEAASYDRKKIKRTLHKYKVKKDHRLIMIDHCEKYYIEQTPAYVWVSDKEFNILLIEQEPRHLVLPLYGIKEITYLKKYPANADTDYPVFHKKSLLTDTFRPYLPDYTQSTVMTDLTSYKNLYGFGPGIYCTNRSAKNLFDLLSVDFRVDDKVTTSNKVNIFFKECYKAGILLRDNVIDANGYAEMISRSLDDMAKSTISNGEFQETLRLLIRNKIITQEFANHYMDVRDKLRLS